MVMPNKSLQLTVQSAGALRPSTELGRCTAVGWYGGWAAESGSEFEQVAELWPLRSIFSESTHLERLRQVWRLPVSGHSQ